LIIKPFYTSHHIFQVFLIDARADNGAITGALA
jgi:hypothetical protein